MDVILLSEKKVKLQNYTYNMIPIWTVKRKERKGGKKGEGGRQGLGKVRARFSDLQEIH